MRTAIYMGMIYIGDCIGKPAYSDNTAIRFMAIAMIVFIVMDAFDFLTKKRG